MSMKSDKSDTKSHHASVPTKDDIAIVPPKKVGLQYHHPPTSRSILFRTLFTLNISF